MFSFSGTYFNCIALKKLIKLDPRWIEKVSVQTIDEETLIEKLMQNLSGKDKQLLQMVLYKFAMPKA